MIMSASCPVAPSAPNARRRRRRAAAIGVSILSWAAAAQAKSIIGYLKPAPVVCSPLSSASCGVAGVLPRDSCQGSESAQGAGVPPADFYWDGQIIRAADGKYHMFMSTWPGSSANGFGDWTSSHAFHAISSMGVEGPYQRPAYVYSSHKGHTVTAAE